MLQQKLQADQIASLKSGDKKKLEVVRFVLAKVKNVEIEKRQELTDEEVINVLRKQLKELNESIEAFEKGGRADLATASRDQAKIIQEYLPAEMSDDDLKKEIETIIAANKAVYDQDPKKIIGICMGKLRSKADPRRIMALLQSRT